MHFGPLQRLACIMQMASRGLRGGLRPVVSRTLHKTFCARDTGRRGAAAQNQLQDGSKRKADCAGGLVGPGGHWDLLNGLEAAAVVEAAIGKSPHVAADSCLPARTTSGGPQLQLGAPSGWSSLR